MSRFRSLCVLAALASPSPALVQDSLAAPIGKAIADARSGTATCRSSDPNEVVVCGRSQQRYRIDPQVLAATRAAEAPPPKPELDATQESSCTGQACGGGTIPLVRMALTAIKAAELAAQGDDWRDAFRTRPDQYKVYEESNAAKKGHISVGVTAGNK